MARPRARKAAHRPSATVVFPERPCGAAITSRGRRRVSGVISKPGRPALQFRDGHGTLVAGFARHAPNAIVWASGEDSVFLAVFLNHCDQVNRAILDAVAAPLALLKINGNDEHSSSKLSHQPESACR